MKSARYGICVGLAVALTAATVTLAAEPTRPLAERVKEISLPELNFREAYLPDVLSFLAQETYRLKKEHVNFVLASTSDRGRPITLQLRNVPLAEAIRYIAEVSGMQYRVERSAIVFMDAAAPPSRMETRIYRVRIGIFTPTEEAAPPQYNLLRRNSF